MELIKEYYENGFDYLEEGDEMEIVKFIQENAQDAPTLYRGISIDEELEEGDELFLQGNHMFASMTPNENDAWAFGNAVMVVEGLEGHDMGNDGLIKEWIVEDQKVGIDSIEEKDGMTYYYCS
jgi:hypothetical protein